VESLSFRAVSVVEAYFVWLPWGSPYDLFSHTHSQKISLDLKVCKNRTHILAFLTHTVISLFPLDLLSLLFTMDSSLPPPPLDSLLSLLSLFSTDLSHALIPALEANHSHLFTSSLDTIAAEYDKVYKTLNSCSDVNEKGNEKGTVDYDGVRSNDSGYIKSAILKSIMSLLETIKQYDGQQGNNYNNTTTMGGDNLSTCVGAGTREVRVCERGEGERNVPSLFCVR
jgi:hypothetical protein